jgi:WD40 repeat protein
MPLSPGTRLGPYEIVSSIGAGGMGEVYRAHDTKLGRDVAIKVLPDVFASDADRMARFEREAQVLASLNHPHIATIHGLEVSNNIRGLVMELVEGPTLAERIVEGAIPLDEALAIAKQIAEGLEYAHERGIIHRDLKPANVKLTGDGQVKLLDFGLAKALDKPVLAGNPSISPTLTIDSTRSGFILGTAAYMAPEQARGAVVDKRADIWSFGCVLYEMLTRKRAFAGETTSDTLAAVLRAEPVWDVVPTRIRRLVRRCLEKDPKRRLRDIGEARLAIEEYLTGEASAELAPQPTRLRVLPWGLAGMLALTTIVALSFLWRVTQSVSEPLMRLRVNLGPEFALAGEAASAILSPEGTRIVYMGGGTDGKVRLYTRLLDQEQAEPLAGTEDAYGPFFSPDGQFVGFFAAGKLKKISVRGGGTVELCDAPGLYGGSWGEDGNIIAAFSVAGRLYRVPSGGGSAQPVTEFKQEKNEHTHRWPQVLPGAQAVLFTAHTTTVGYDDAAIEVQSLRTGKRKTLARGYFGRYVPSGHLVYLRQGILYAVLMDVERLELSGSATPVITDVASEMTFSRTGTLMYVRAKVARQTLMWLGRDGRTQPLRPVAAELLWSPRFSPDGKRLAVNVLTGGNLDVWVYELERDIMTRLTFTPGYDGFPVWSPDGKHIVFRSDRGGSSGNLYWMRADGAGEAVRLTESKYQQLPFSLSPDGKRLAFMELSSKTNNFDLWTLPLAEVETDHPKVGRPEPFLETPFSKWAAMISPDGHWLAYQSAESGNNEVYVRRFPGPGERWQISTDGEGLGSRWTPSAARRNPIWSRKRHELFYRSREGMMVASYAANGETFVATKPRLWAEKRDLGDFDLAPDGRRFAIVQAEATEPKGPSQVTLLLNFFDDLRRRVPSGRN